MDENEIILKFLPLFKQELERAASYIAIERENPVAAERLVNAVESAIYKRLPIAECFEPIPSVKQRDNPYYRIYVKNYIVLYVVIDKGSKKTMEVRHFLHNKQDYSKL